MKKNYLRKENSLLTNQIKVKGFMSTQAIYSQPASKPDRQTKSLVIKWTETETETE